MSAIRASRSVYWDLEIGVAILLVIIGHQIQTSCYPTEAYIIIESPFLVHLWFLYASIHVGLRVFLLLYCIKTFGQEGFN